MSKSKIIIITIIGVVISLIMGFFNAVMIAFIPTAFVREDKADYHQYTDPSSSASDELPEGSQSSSDASVEVVKKYDFSDPFAYPDFSYESFYDKQSGKTMPYRLALPKNYSAGKKHPVLLFLHGAGEIGTDNESHLSNFAQSYFTAGDILSEAIVICPQTPGGWNISDWDEDGFSNNENGYLAIAKRIVDYNVKKYNGDTDRIYLTGLSMGSFATWTLLSEYPYYFAVSVPVCGGGGDVLPQSVIDTPIWLYHGTSDRTVPFYSSEQTYNALIEAGAKEVKFTRLNGIGHNAWDNAYVDREMFTWMFCHTKNGMLERNYTLGNTFEILSSNGEVIITESDIIDAELVFDDGYDYIEILLSSESADRLRKEYKSNKNKLFSVKYIGKNLYDYKVLEIPKDNVFRIERTIEENDYKSIYSSILRSFYD